MQSVLSDITNENSKGMKGGFLQEKDFKDQQISEIQRFVDFLFLYRIMSKFQGEHTFSRKKNQSCYFRT